MTDQVQGDLCVRCRESAASESIDGLPTCGRCAALLRVKSEGSRACPVDGTGMQKDVLQNVVLDRCPSCGGVWLDHDELEALLRLAAERADDPGFLGSMLLDLAW